MARTDFFLSHHQSEAGTQASLMAAALRQLGFRVFLDIDTHKAGDIAATSRGGVSAARAFLVFLGKEFGIRVDRKTDWVAFELREARSLGKPVVPILLDGVDFDTLSLPSEFAWLASQRAYRWDRSRIGALVAEILLALGVKAPSVVVRSPLWSSAVAVLLILLGSSIWAVFNTARTMGELLDQAKLRQQSVTLCESSLKESQGQLARCSAPASRQSSAPK